MYEGNLNKLHEAIIKKSAENFLPHIKINTRISPQKQMNVYLEGYRLRLASAVEADYPAFCNYLGKRVDNIIHDYVVSNKSDLYSLDFYPLKFAAAIQSKKIDDAAKQLATLEASIAAIFLAPDSDQLPAEKLLEIINNDIENFNFTPRTALIMHEFSYDVESYMRAFREEKAPSKISKKPIFILIVRHNNEVRRHYLEHEEYLLLQNLFAKNSIEQAMEKAKINKKSEEIINNNLPSWLQKWLAEGFFSDDNSSNSPA